MNTTLQSLLWQFAHRHRLAWIFCVLSLLAIGITVAWWPSPTISLGSAILLSSIPVMQLTYLIAIFSFGRDNDLLSCDSTYPTHMMRLPMRSSALVLYPFLIGATTLIVYWVAVLSFVMWPLAELRQPSSFGMPVLITPAVCICSLAWLQAVLWSNYRHALFRSVATIAAMVTPLIFASEVFSPDLQESVTLTVLVIGTLLANGMAILNLSAARHGHTSGWGIPTRRYRSKNLQSASAAREPASTPTRRKQVTSKLEHWWNRFIFASATRAQVWYEWRRYCVPIVAILVAGTTVFFCISLTWPHARMARVNILLLPWFIFALASVGLGGLNHHVGDRHVSIFFASRPLTSAQYVCCKWIAAAIAAVCSCLFAVGLFFLATYLASDELVLDKGWSWLRTYFPVPHLVYGSSVGFLIYCAVTWMLFVQALPIKLSGRPWMQTVLISFFVGIGAMFLLGLNLDHSSWIPWTVSGLLCLKFYLGWLSLQKLRQHEVVSHAAMVEAIQEWCLVACLFLVAIAGFLIPWKGVLVFFAAPLILLAMPISRLAWAPLALHWNRHG